MKTETGLEFTITNTCTCVTYNEETGDFQESPECWGDCWDSSVEDFYNITEELRNNNETDWWKVTNIQLWDREISGYFNAYKTEDIIRGMAVNSEWIMRGTVFSDRIEYSLSHHDAPTGSRTVLRPVSSEEQEEKGLY